jgi:hypothetical protein
MNVRKHEIHKLNEQNLLLASAKVYCTRCPAEAWKDGWQMIATTKNIASYGITFYHMCSVHVCIEEVDGALETVS